MPSINENWTYLEWNVHGSGGYNNYSTPSFVINEILKENTDIFVLTEFFQNSNFLQNNVLVSIYHLFFSPFNWGYNQVLVGVKKEKCKSANCQITTIPHHNLNLPEYLRVDIEDRLTIVGMRIKTQCTLTQKQNQFTFMDSQYTSLTNKCIILGDFNVAVGNASMLMPSWAGSIYSPRTSNNSNWSYVHRNKQAVGIDLIAVKGIAIQRKPRGNAGIQQYAEYHWRFVNSANGYGALMPSDYKSNLNGLPDHAILKGDFIL